MKKYLMNFIVLTAMAAFLLTGCTEAASEEKIKEEAKEAADLEIDPEPDAAEMISYGVLRYRLQHTHRIRNFRKRLLIPAQLHEYFHRDVVRIVPISDPI